MTKFLIDDTQESNQWWETDSHLPVQDKDPLESNQYGVECYGSFSLGMGRPVTAVHTKDDGSDPPTIIV